MSWEKLKGARLRYRLAISAVLAVALTMGAAAAVFNYVLGGRVASEARNAIEIVMGWSEGDSYDVRNAYALPLNDSFEIEYDGEDWYSDEEILLASWCAAHPAVGDIQRARLGAWTCYVCIYDLAGDDWDYWMAFGDDTASGYLAVYVDVTEEQALIEAVNISFALIGVIGAAVGGLFGYLAGKRIEESQEAQKRFYENMSHELKTPLAAIRGYAEGVEAQVVDPEEAARVITGETERMSAQIDAILNLSRLEAGGITLKREPLEVADFVQDCLMPFEGAVRARGLDVALDLVEGQVSADENWFAHAFTNVVTNAVRHAGTRVCVSYDGSELAVWNDGVVPSEAELAHLFDRFYAGASGGTGVGLALAREIVELHGWTMAATLVGSGLRVAIRMA